MSVLERKMTFFDFNSTACFGSLSQSIPWKGDVNAHRASRVLSVNGLFPKVRIPETRTPLSRQLQGSDIFMPRSISLHGICTAHQSGEPARSGNVSACNAYETVSCRHPRKNLPKHFGRRQRSQKLANLCRPCPDTYSRGTKTVCGRRFRRGPQRTRLRLRLDNDQPLSGSFPLGTFPKAQGSNQAAYPDGPPRQYPLFYAHYTGDDPRCYRPRRFDFGAGLFLSHRSSLHRFCSFVRVHSAARILHHSRQEQYPLPPMHLSPDRPSHRTQKRSDHHSHRSQNLPKVSGPTSPCELFRCRDRYQICLPLQQLYAPRSDNPATLQMSLEGRNLLQMDQTISSYQDFLRHVGERCTHADMDCYQCVCPCFHYQKDSQYRAQSRRNYANSQPFASRRCASLAISYNKSPARYKCRMSQPTAIVCVITGQY
jgi:hypothetical protein